MAAGNPSLAIDACASNDSNRSTPSESVEMVIEHDHVIEALPANRADQRLRCVANYYSRCDGKLEKATTTALPVKTPDVSLLNR